MSTQSAHNFKVVYEFKIDVPKEIEVSETVVEGDKTTIVKSKKVEPVPVWFCFKKPSRHEREDADLYRAKQWNKFVNAGILPEAILVREYSNYGGIFNDADKREWVELRVSLHDKMEEYQLARGVKDNEKAEKLITEIVKIRNEITKLERQQNAFFDNTAESKARVKLIQYHFLNFSYTKDAADKPWEQFFKGHDEEAKFDHEEKLADENDQVYSLVRDRLLTIASLYVSMDGNLTKEEIAEFENQGAENASDATAPVTS